MDAIPNSPKALDQSSIGGEDRISNMPDSVLCHVLSKLSTKSAVGTTILSRRWKHLFASIPNPRLWINDSLHLNNHLGAADSTLVSHRNANFIRFMYHLLDFTLRDVPRIHSLYLYCHQDYGNHHIDSWISSALRLNVSRLRLFFDVKNTGVSTHSLFHCKSLDSLSLMQHHLLNVPASVCWPNLTKLALFYATFPSGESLERIVDGCPLLETLTIEGCVFEDVEFLRISSRSLKSLSLNSCSHVGAYELELDTPALGYLDYSDYAAGGYWVEDLSFLRGATINIGPSVEQLEEEEQEDILFYNQNITKLVKACSNVNSLELARATVSAIQCSSLPMPTFSNLTKLEFSNLSVSGWELLPDLLERAPNLEIFIFKWSVEYEGCYARFQSRLPNFVPSCVSLHLRRVCFEEFKGEKDELELVEYFLKTAEVLKKMEIVFSSTLATEKQFSCTRTKLWLLQKSSSDCQIDCYENREEYLLYLLNESRRRNRDFAG